MSGQYAEDALRAQVRSALHAAGLSQAEAARQLGVSTKHLNMMLVGSATLTLTWAEGLLGLCGQILVISVQPDEPICGTRHHDYPQTVCTEPPGHYRRDRDPHAGLLVIDGQECGGAAWDEPKETL